MQTHNDDDHASSERIRRMFGTGEEKRESDHEQAERDAALEKLGTAAAAEELDRLRERAAGMVERGESGITAGTPGESPLFQAEKFGVLVTKWPDDPDCLRISVGEGNASGIRYLALRGGVDRAIGVLERAARALRALQ